MKSRVGQKNQDTNFRKFHTVISGKRITVAQTSLSKYVMERSVFTKACLRVIKKFQELFFVG